MTGYKAMHKTLNSLRLPARYSACHWCGLSANDWAYQWDDAEELDSEHGPYSQNTTSYRAMCRRCHLRFDDAHRSYGAERFPFEVARLKEAAYAAVSDERRAADTRAREANREVALRHIEAQEATRKPRRTKASATAIDDALALMARGFRHNALERGEG
ncbi:hypothetical protein OG746_20870 [Streptomyces sp. NBC_01016]|uniref:hypothetical protein n=1 Tax=Streptomyces sp. NBC_01016 TaxID=2903720 RepID=UPI00224E0521|nr:hypothetical protein [Streptomyces sp. NBC_01016]MCX4831192.1 hypothetical protein [Streptomyces sp. NBC_01016]